jgi:GNAT superfamily N-acetyltransferase
MINIAHAISTDIDNLEKIDPSLRTLTSRRKTLMHSLDFGTVLIASYEHNPAGFIELHNHFYGHWFIELLFVRDGYREKGIGTLLLEKVCQMHKGEKLFSSTNESNRPMRRLFAKVGFIQSGFIENLDEGDPEFVYLRLPNVA